MGSDMHISMALQVMDKDHCDHVGPGSIHARPLSVLLTIPDSQTILEDDILQTHQFDVCVCAYSQVKNIQKLSKICGWCFRRDDEIMVRYILVAVLTKYP